MRCFQIPATRSRYTRLMRLTVAAASLYVFTLLTMIWFKTDYRSPSSNIYSFWFDSSDIVTGVVASFLTFPLSLFLSFLFKRSRSRHSYVYPSRPPTGIDVPMDVEIPIQSKTIDICMEDMTNRHG